MAKITSYRSGSGAISDLRGYMLAGVPVGLPCVSVSDGSLRYLSAHVEQEMIEYASAGNPVFIDSGAFSVFQYNLQTKNSIELDFDEIMARYFRYSVVGNLSLALVMPDVIGDQKATLDLQSKYKREICELIKRGVDVIIPIQKGEMDPGRCWNAVRDIVGSNIRVAIPSNKEAFSVVDQVELLFTSNPPRRLHLLGITHANRQFAKKIGKILEYSAEMNISCDGNRLRAMLGKDRKVTQSQIRFEEDFKAIIKENSVLDDNIETDMWLEVQAGLSCKLTANQTFEVAETLAIDCSKDMLAASAEGQLLSWIENNVPGFGEYSEDALFKVVFSWVSREQISKKFKEADQFFTNYVFCDVPPGVSRVAAVATHAVEPMPRIKIQRNLFDFLERPEAEVTA